MNPNLSYVGQIICEVAQGTGRGYRLCGHTPMFQCRSMINPDVITHACDECVIVFLEDVCAEGPRWDVETLTVRSWRN